MVKPNSLLGERVESIPDAMIDGIPTYWQMLESTLGIPSGFFTSLLEEEDWSFVIKLHALFEAATSYALAKSLDRPEIESAIANIDMGDPRYGKIALAFKLNLISENERNFLRKLGELRNDLVHDIRQVRFSFPTYIGGLDANQRKVFRKSLAFAFIGPDGDTKKVDDLLATAPHIPIMLTAYFCLVSLHSKGFNAQMASLMRTSAEQAKTGLLTTENPPKPRSA